jgi:hypothetical protein
MNQAFCVITDQPFPANALGVGCGSHAVRANVCVNEARALVMKRCVKGPRSSGRIVSDALCKRERNELRVRESHRAGLPIAAIDCAFEDPLMLNLIVNERLRVVEPSAYEH